MRPLSVVALLAACVAAARGASSFPRTMGGITAQKGMAVAAAQPAQLAHYHTAGCTTCGESSPVVAKKLTTIEFAVRSSDTRPGEVIGVVGQGKALGDWKNPIVMGCVGTWPLWQVRVKLPEHGMNEYKYVKIAEDGTILDWEDHHPWNKGNRELKLTDGSLKESLHVDDGQFGIWSQPIYTVSVLVRVRVESV